MRKYWEFKFKKDLWPNFETLEEGDTFDTSIKWHKKLSGRIGDIAFWYRTDYGKQGIYFVTEIISEPRINDEYANGYSIDMRIIKSLVTNPFDMSKNKSFKRLHEELNTGKYGVKQGGVVEIKDSKIGEKLYEKLVGELTYIESSLPAIDMNDKYITAIKEIKEQYIKSENFFNPFIDSGIFHDELRNLKFLSNLLNPYGTHFKKEFFLKEFIDALLKHPDLKNNKYLKGFDYSTATVSIEKVIDDRKRIDLWIETEDFIIAIEGKVSSADHEKQLLNYDKFLRKNEKPYILIYLTLTGNEPTYEYPENLILMSFEDDIFDFLNNSIEKLTERKMKFLIKDYMNAINSYLYNLPANWEYELEIADQLSKDSETYKKYNEMKNRYFQNKSKYKFTEVEDIANNFELTKAKIEYDFLFYLNHEFFEKFPNTDYDDEFVQSFWFYSGNENKYYYRNLLTVLQERRKRIFSDNSNKAMSIVWKLDDKKYAAIDSYSGTGGIFLALGEYGKSEEQLIELVNYKYLQGENMAKLLEPEFKQKVSKEMIDAISSYLQS